MKILVTGGAGYIGSHTCVSLIENGYDVVIVDNFSNSERDVVNRIGEIAGAEVRTGAVANDKAKSKLTVYECDLCDYEALLAVFAEEIATGDPVAAVIHFAGYKAVGESVEKPLMYYQNNLGSTMNLLKCMKQLDVKNLIFSSSATVYSSPQLDEIMKAHPEGLSEDMPLGTINPYGATKLMIENILKDICAADSSFNVGILRYFNPIGAHPSGLIGDDPRGIPNNLLPYVAKVASGELPVLNVFGNDYDTPDGTCIRDYIHVMDLAQGHMDMLKHLDGLSIYNLGTGNGYSVLDVIKAFEEAAGVPVPYKIAPRRLGDAPVCFANASLAEKELGWKAKYGINEMCTSAWNYTKGSLNLK